MIVLVTGATGAVGPAVIDALLRERTDVRVLARGDVRRADVDVFHGDVTDPHAVDQAIAGSDAVIHLAAVLHETRVTPAVCAEYADVNVGGTLKIVASAAAHRVPRIIFASTIAVYGYNRGVVLTEKSPIAPDTGYGRSKAEAEAIVRAAGGTVLRFGAVYGARVKGNYRRLVESLRRHCFVPIGTGSNRRTVIYDEDAAAAVVAALRAPDAEGQTYNVAHPRTPRVNEIVEAICAALGRRPPRFQIPEAAVRTPVAAIEAVSRAIGMRTPATRAMLDKYLEDVVVSSEKIHGDLGFVAQHDIDRGWAAAIAAMRLAGRI